MPRKAVMTGNELLQRIRPREHRLANGLTLLVREDHSAPVVAIVTHVRAGYFDEPDTLVGISHVLEHMYFKGTGKRGVGEIARATKSAGGYLNAGTIYDHTTYYTVLPSSAVEMGMDIQADALINSTIDAAELEKELQVIIQEVKRKLDNPAALATETLFEALFDAHPMRRWRMGTEEQLSRYGRDHVVGFYRDMYRAGNIVLVVSGDVDADRVIAHAERLYGPLDAGEPERTERDEPERRGARFREMAGDIAHTYVELGWRTPGSLHPDTAALDVLAMALGQGRASRLYRGVRERGLVSSIDAYNYTPTEIGVFGISLECEPGDTAAALRAAWHETEIALEEGVGDDEMDRVRTVFEARLLRRLETAEGRANLLAEWHAHGDWREMGRYLDRVRALSAADVRDAARRYLSADRVTALVYRPEGEAALGWSDENLVARLQEAAGTDRLEPVGLEPVTVIAAPVEPGAPVLEDGVTQYDLSGGRLVVKPRSAAPLVSMGIFRQGGRIHEVEGRAGITGLMMRSSVKGTAHRSAERIALESERLGGAIAATAGADTLSWTLTVPAERFEEGMDLLADVALNPTFPDREVDRERTVMRADLDRLRDDMYRYPLRLLLTAAFPGHPYGFSADIVENGIGQVGPDALREWHATEVAEPWVFVVGDIDPRRVTDAVAERMGTPARRLPTDAPDAVWPDETAVQQVRRERAQTAIALGLPAPDRNHPDGPALEVLSNAISGLGNRLFEELRSRRSLAYTVSAYPIARRHGGMFVGYIATSPDRAEEARAGLIDELLRLRTEPPTEDELERARRYTVGGWQIRTQTNAAQLAELAGALMLGEGLDEIRRYEERIRAVDREAVRAAAERWFDPDRLAEGVVRGTD